MILVRSDKKLPPTSSKALGDIANAWRLGHVRQTRKHLISTLQALGENPQAGDTADIESSSPTRISPARRPEESSLLAVGTLSSVARSWKDTHTAHGSPPP
ncbi:lospin [Marssonina coronariae]|uniref:Lospin n=1 Tax=Diplocarpon coronariae TaxID=2795749 RepID=A0A218Z5W7_9HELO|nr:lospin [Marssonina coronariae]